MRTSRKHECRNPDCRRHAVKAGYCAVCFLSALRKAEYDARMAEAVRRALHQLPPKPKHSILAWLRKKLRIGQKSAETGKPRP